MANKDSPYSSWCYHCFPGHRGCLQWNVYVLGYNDSYCSLGILRSARAMVCLMRAMVCVTQARRHTSQCWVNLTSTTNFLWCEHMFMKRVEIARSHLVIFKGFHIVKLCNKLLHSRCFSTHAHASLLASKRPSLGPIAKCLNCNKNHSNTSGCCNVTLNPIKNIGISSIILFAPYWSNLNVSRLLWFECPCDICLK